MKFFNQRIHFFIARFFRHIVGFQNGKNVFFHRHFTENGSLLRQITDTGTRAHIHRQAGNILPVKRNRAGIRLDDAYYHIKGSSFAGAVRAEQTNDAALLHTDADIIYNASVRIFFYKISCFNYHYAASTCPVVSAAASWAAASVCVPSLPAAALFASACAGCFSGT